MQQALSFFQRLRGVMGRTDVFSPLHFPRCRVIHTAFMRQNIHLHWHDKTGKIIKRVYNARPWNVYWCLKADSVTEYAEHHNFRKDESGQALVEFAVLLPFLILIIFGFFQLSLALHENLKLQHVTFYATRVASLTNDDQKITGAVEAFYPPGKVEITVENQNTDGHSITSNQRRYGDLIQLKLTHPYPLQIPYLTLTSIDLNHRAAMPVLCQNNSIPYTCE